MNADTTNDGIGGDVLRRDLAALGVTPATTLIVHSSLRSIGFVTGGATTVVRALIDVLGPDGTLAMPAATPHCADPAQWPDAPESPAALEAAREQLRGFDAASTPTEMGAIAETFRNWPGTLRSNHPLESVCARGPHAAEITRDHPIPFSEGPGSPFAKLHGLGSWILLLGVGFNRCSALHFAESLVAKRRTTTNRFPMLEDGRRVWVEASNVADDNDTHFPVIGERFVAAGRTTSGRVGQSHALLFPMRDLVAFAVDYFEKVLA